jgi:phosphoribosylformylglycinamidine (FGAM) synthase-like enzyme
MISKKLIFPALIVIAAGGIVAIRPMITSAQTANPLSGLVQMIAQKFNLDQTQVQTVVDQYRTQQKQTVQQSMEQRQKQRLDQLVTQGKITSAQEQAIITELAALKTKYNPANFKSLSAADRKTQMQNEQNELKAWAQANGVDPTLIMPGFGMGFRGGWGGHKNRPSPTPTL